MATGVSSAMVSALSDGCPSRQRVAWSLRSGLAYPSRRSPSGSCIWLRSMLPGMLKYSVCRSSYARRRRSQRLVLTHRQSDGGMRTAIRISIITLMLWDCAGDSSAPGPAPEPTPGVPVAYSTGGTSLTSLAAANPGGDDHPDLIAVARGDGSIRVLPGQPGGRLGAALTFIAGDDPVQAVAGDVNGD